MQTTDSPSNAGAVRYRVGAAARLAGMPVTTLRVWESRYQISSCGRGSSGHWLYSPEDVQRLSAIKQLTQNGHAISTLVHLPLAQLLQLQGMQQSANQPGLPSSSLIVAVVGNMLALRVVEPAFATRCVRPISVLPPFESLEQLALALASGKVQADVVVIHQPSLQPKWLANQSQEFGVVFALPVCVVYGFSSAAARQELAQNKVMAIPFAQFDYALCNWLSQLRNERDTAIPTTAQAAQAVPARRWSDEVLAHFLKLSGTVQCECPKHVAGLLIQLMDFEVYSSQCESRSGQDAALHRDLRQMAAQARLLFENALERIAVHEGLAFPSSSSAASISIETIKKSTQK